MSEKERTNKFMIGGTRDKFMPVVPIQWPLTADDALLLAAWLVEMAEPFATEEFANVVKGVKDTCG